MPTIHTHSFNTLTTHLLHDILRLRCDVFIVEQSAAYADIDGLDLQALHLCMFKNETLIGYVRILRPGINFPEATMGRIVLHPLYRGNNLGRLLVTHAITEIRNNYAEASICIEAREDLQPFYKTLGFSAISVPYDWAGITYVKMLSAPYFLSGG